MTPFLCVLFAAPCESVRGRAAARWLRRSASLASRVSCRISCAGRPRDPREKTPCALLRSNSFREHETVARLKPCWVAGPPAASACALFAPQPAHAQLRFTIEVIHEWVPNAFGPRKHRASLPHSTASPQHRASPAALDGFPATPCMAGSRRESSTGARGGRPCGPASLATPRCLIRGVCLNEA